MIKISFTKGPPEIDRKATQYKRIADEYVLFDSSGAETGRHQASQVRSISKVDDDEDGGGAFSVRPGFAADTINIA